ncbi:MAG: hypothetical protein J6S67_20095 [Methanobrevibacter sp.]|nr:hypothetical protein [Methanobrevibacter sp.]
MLDHSAYPWLTSFNYGEIILPPTRTELSSFLYNCFAGLNPINSTVNTLYFETIHYFGKNMVLGQSLWNDRLEQLGWNKNLTPCVRVTTNGATIKGVLPVEANSGNDTYAYLPMTVLRKKHDIPYLTTPYQSGDNMVPLLNDEWQQPEWPDTPQYCFGNITRHGNPEVFNTYPSNYISQVPYLINLND